MSRSAWVQLWNRIGAQGNADAAFEQLDAAYSRPPRAYHNLSHIEDCLGQFASARDLAREPDAVEFALWFHDAIYDSRVKDNEERSAGLALAAIASARLSPAFGETVSKLILATKHTEPPKDSDSALFVDVDLSILGRPPDKFDEYERQIRVEYAWVEEKAFAGGRSAVLKHFLERPVIFTTEFFREKYEQAARRNMERSLRQLSAL